MLRFEEEKSQYTCVSFLHRNVQSFLKPIRRRNSTRSLPPLSDARSSSSH